MSWRPQLAGAIERGAGGPAAGWQQVWVQLPAGPGGGKEIDVDKSLTQLVSNSASHRRRDERRRPPAGVWLVADRRGGRRPTGGANIGTTCRPPQAPPLSRIKLRRRGLDGWFVGVGPVAPSAQPCGCRGYVRSAFDGEAPGAESVDYGQLRTSSPDRGLRGGRSTRRHARRGRARRLRSDADALAQRA